MGMTREELEAAIGGEPGGGGMSLWSEEMDDNSESATVEAELAASDVSSQQNFDPKQKSSKPFTGNTGLKVVFRGLPPKITEEEFLDITGIQPPEFNYFFLQYPNPYRPYDSESRTIAYMNFVDPEMGEIYIEKFDRFMFIDKHGVDFVCVTCRAPYQDIPRNLPKPDPMEGTVFETEDFASFTIKFEAGAPIFGVRPLYEDGVEMCDTFLKELEEKEKHPPQKESCPLVDYFREMRMRDRGGRRIDDRKTQSGRVRSSIKKDKRKEERKERRDRDRKDKRLLKTKKKYDEQKETGTEKSNSKSIQEDPENEEGSSKAEGEDQGKNKDQQSPSKESGNQPGSSNPHKESKVGSKYSEESDGYYNRKGNRSWESKQKGGGVGPTKYGPNSYSKDSSPRSYDKKPPPRTRDDSGEGVEGKSWRKPGGGGNSPRNPQNSARWPKKEFDSGFRGDKKFTSGDKERSSSSKYSQEKSEGTEGADAQPVKILTRDVSENQNQGESKADHDNKTEVPERASGPSDKPPAKKIVKKIIRVRKPRPKEPETGGEDGSGETPASKSRPSANSVKPKKLEGNSEKSGPSDNISAPPKKETANEEKDSRVRKGRPDIQIYRPGSWRTSAKAPAKSENTEGGNGNGNGTRPGTSSKN